MTNVFSLIDKMLKNLNDEHNKTELFYGYGRAALTDIYKNEAYIQQLRYILERMKKILKLYESRVRNSNQKNPATPECLLLMNQVLIEFHLFQATNQGFNQRIEHLRKNAGLIDQTSGRMISVRREFSGIVKKFEDVLKNI